MFLEKWDEILPPKRTKMLLIFSIILLIIIYPIMAYFFMLSENTRDLMSSQLSFSGSYMKTYYKNIGNLDIYRIAESLDFIFMIAYGSLIISLALIIARKFEERNALRNAGYVMALFGIIVPCLDAMENSFIMLMLTDPSGFPEIWAIAHSIFALIKWILLFIAIIYAILALIIRIIKKK